MKELFVINIGRQLGSGGRAVGEIISRRLGMRLYDKELLSLAAKQGVECYGVAARTSWPTLMHNYFIREGFAVTYYRLTGEI